ncbi:hypothetical protein SADUNF_Sadunf19G0005700 [Salix dunnii]|uniref:Uncharacterized protein n=1 Tax=Salix dunnii TaxID=1413687 RepID=A0A835IXP2_9ROSI|nr:hypothetical protein SADUNF_Sadunf19G0005700 [Salix dunnii]
MEMNKWRLISNGSDTEVARIIVGWDLGVFDMVNVAMSSQWVTCSVHSVMHGSDITASFFYGHNVPATRQEMWEYIKGNRAIYKDHPWVLMGDFNATMKPTNSEGGDPSWSRQKQEFGQCLHQAELHTVPYRGIKYTWHNGQKGEGTIMKKLDWVIGNTALAIDWPNAMAHFFPISVSDHSSMLLQLRQDHLKPKPSFKLTSKLQLVKACLKHWHKVNINNISLRVNKAKADWDEAQMRLDANPREISTPITKEEIQAALFSIFDSKAPGPDGFSARFFKAGWSIVGEDFVAAVQDFFISNSLPKCVNATTLALIPKVENPSTLDEYRPISCCNVVYKSISKVLATRLKKALEHTIGVLPPLPNNNGQFSVGKMFFNGWGKGS